MAIQDILLRILINSPLSTKGSKLTSSEVDQNFIEVYNELFLISNPINVTAYDNGATYVGGESTLVSFASQLWIFISATDKSGVSPGSDATVWTRQATNRLAHEDVNLVSLTRAELLALQVAGTVHPSRLYFISDRNVYVFGITTTQVSLEGVLLATNPDYQNVGGNVLGVWTAAIDDGSPGLQTNDIAIYNGLHFKSLTGNTSAILSPPNDALNWVLLATTDSSYINEIDPIHYDLSNDVIVRRTDKRGNKIETENSFIDSVSPALNPIDVFQWGNDNVVGNTIGNNGILSCLNNLQSIKYNDIRNADITADMATNDLLRNEINSGVIDISAVANNFTDEGKVFDVSLTIESVDVLDLNSTLQQAVPTPGVGKYIRAVDFDVSATIGGPDVPYVTNTVIILITDTADTPHGVQSDILKSTATRTLAGLMDTIGSIAASDLQFIENKALMVSVNGGNPGTGTFSIKLRIAYKIINIT